MKEYAYIYLHILNNFPWYEPKYITLNYMAFLTASGYDAIFSAYIRSINSFWVN